MTQREKISNNFSDAYILALIEVSDPNAIVQKFSKDFPEMTSQFEENARSLNLLYGYIPTSEKSSDQEISAAYKKVSERFASSPARIAAVPAKPNFFAVLRANFSSSPMWAGASLGMGAAVIIALLWQPWALKETGKETAQNGTQAVENTGTSKEYSANEQVVKDPMVLPEVNFRGKNAKDVLTAAQKTMQDSIDAARLKQLSAPKPLSPPQNLQIEALPAPGVIMVHWSPSPDALSYIIEIKGANDDSYVPVTQLSQTGARITSLASGKTYLVRVIAASGERVGPASDAKSILVP